MANRFPTTVLVAATERNQCVQPLSKSSMLQENSVPILCIGELACHTNFKHFEQGRTNRMLDRYGKENFIILKFEPEISPPMVREILNKGLRINGSEYQFLGCSSSGLKERSCYLYRGSVDDVDRILEECGSFSSIKSRSKLLKRIGLLFSEALPLRINIPDWNICEESDIENENGNFTDGCGLVSVDMAQQIKEKCKGIPSDYFPSVYQIRYQGCKGVVMVDRGVKQGCLLIRPSMKKFNPGSKPLQELWLCDYSRPYTFGHLNRQFITLLSSLGVKDEVFLRIQEEHFELLRSMMHDPSAAFQLLQFNNQSELAFRCLESLDGKNIRLQLSILRAKLTEKLDKLRLLVPKSRNVFGVCDPTGTLKYGECFFRYTERGHPKTLHGNVVVAKNPCYLLGDVRVLKCVPLEGLKNVVDCIVFPTNGKRPHPAEIAGSDLDGDQYFVCWDEDLVVLQVSEPYDYPSLDAPETISTITRPVLIDYFASYRSSMGVIDNYYKKWANKKGAGCSECQELGKLFSRSVDASKTGDYVSIPKRLKPPLEDGNDQDVVTLHVWEELQKRAQSEMKLVRKKGVYLSTIDEEFVWNILQEKYQNLSEYQLFRFLQRWCFLTYSDDEQSRDSLLKFMRYIQFGEFTVDQQIEAIDAGIPQKVVTNALNKSSLLPQNLLCKFLLSDPHRTWRFFLHSECSEFKWHHFLKGIQFYPESMVIIKLPDDGAGGVTFVLHFLVPPTLGESDINRGSTIAYFSSPHYGLNEHHILGSNYKLNLNDHTLQLYRGKIQATFIWMGSEQTAVKDSSDMRISVDLTRFKRNILTDNNHPKVRKESVASIEVFVKSFFEEPAYLDIVEVGSSEVAEVMATEDLEDLPSDPEDDQSEKEEERVLEPYSLEEVTDMLLKCAKRGHPCHFQVILDKILSKKNDLGPEALTAFDMLLKCMVTKFCHKLLDTNTKISLQITIASLSSFMKSPIYCLQLLSNICQLRCPDIVEHALAVVLANIQLSEITDYLSVATNWKLWYFIPLNTGVQFSRSLYSLCCSLADRHSVQCAHYDEAELLQALEITQQKSDQIQCDIQMYACRFTHLLLTCLLNEMSSLKQQNHNKTEDTGTQLVKMRAYSCSPEGSEDSGERFCLIGFKRSTKGLSSKNFTRGNYVAVSIMKRDSSSRANVTVVSVAIGKIMKVSTHPADILIELEQPLPSCLKQSIQLQRGHWQLNLIANITGFKRSLEALRSLVDNPTCTGLSSALVLSCACNVQSPHTLTKSINAFLSQNISDSIPAMVSESLNPKQQEAVKAALQRRVSLIHGPPGTGKTHVACEIVKCRLARDSSSPVLVTAETNLAVDNLCEKLMVLGIRVIRIGRLDQISPNVRAISLEGQVERKRIQEGKDKSQTLFPNSRTVKQILQASQVVAATCTSAGDPALKGMTFPFVIIDEATQVTEPTSLIPIVCGSQQLCLIGDPEQLAPTIPTMSKLDGNPETGVLSDLSITLFHRLQKLLPSIFLDEQHRMDPILSGFPSQKFYADRLKTAYCRATQSCPADIRLLKDHGPLIFENVCVTEHSKERRYGTSLQNPLEASAVINVVKDLVDHQVSMQEVVILTPYSGQVMYIRDKLQHEHLSRVKVCTIDAFQGREADFVVFSTVRCNARGELGFIDDRYRMNVLLTRARHGLVGIGCSRILSDHSDLWKDWLESGVKVISQFASTYSGQHGKRQRDRADRSGEWDRSGRRQEDRADRSGRRQEDRADRSGRRQEDRADRSGRRQSSMAGHHVPHPTGSDGADLSQRGKFKSRGKRGGFGGSGGHGRKRT